MKRIIFIILGSINICLAYAQSFNGQYISEWQWDMNKNTNLINQIGTECSNRKRKGFVRGGYAACGKDQRWHY